MSETLPTAVTYSTFEEFTANTRVVAQQTMDDEDWTPAALEAEYIIDSYVNVVQKYDSEQLRKFPTFDRITAGSVIPANVKKAHIMITSWLLLQGAPTATDEEITGKEVLAESLRYTDRLPDSMASQSESPAVMLMIDLLLMRRPFESKNKSSCLLIRPFSKKT